MAITVNLDNHRRIKMPHFYFYFYFNFNWMCRYISLNKSLHIVFPGDDPRKGYESSNPLLLFLSWNSAMIFTAVISFVSSLLFSTALSLSPMGEEEKIELCFCWWNAYCRVLFLSPFQYFISLKPSSFLSIWKRINILFEHVG